MATIKDIANKLGVTSGTVSKGLNGGPDISETLRQQIFDTAVEMGYVPRSMKDKAQQKVCIMVEKMNYQTSDEFGYHMIVGFKKAAMSEGFSVEVVSFEEALKSNYSYDAYMLKHGFNGAFLIGFLPENLYLEEVRQTLVPTVLLDNAIYGNSHVGYVGADSYEGIDSAIWHLKELGHRKIALLSGDQNSMVTKDRNHAFITAMQKYELEIQPELMACGDYLTNMAKWYLPAFLEQKVTGILCASDRIAFDVIGELKATGKQVPEEISVIGFDDIPLAREFQPALTTIRQDQSDLGKCAFFLLNGLMNHIAMSKLLLRPEFIVRDSTAKTAESLPK